MVTLQILLKGLQDVSFSFPSPRERGELPVPVVGVPSECLCFSIEDSKTLHIPRRVHGSLRYAGVLPERSFLSVWH
jgi:hypothetical protein